MTSNFLLNGLILGFLIAIPIGPISILCIRKSLSIGTLSGFFTGLGAATADGFYGAVAAFGLTFVSNFLIDQKIPLQVVGIVFLLYLGIKTFFEKPVAETSIYNQKKKNLFFDYISTFGLTIVNPMTIASFIAVFASIGFVASGNYKDASLLTLGVFLGSTIWWIILSNLMGILRKKADNKLLTIINKISGIIIIIFATLIIINLINS